MPQPAVLAEVVTVVALENHNRLVPESVGYRLSRSRLYIGILSTSLLLGVAYSARPFRFKGRGIWGVIIAPLLGKVIPVCLACIHDRRFGWYFLVVALAESVKNAIDILFHQIVDYKNDWSSGISTFPVARGVEPARLLLHRLAAGGALAAISMSATLAGLVTEYRWVLGVACLLAVPAALLSRRLNSRRRAGLAELNLPFGYIWFGGIVFLQSPMWLSGIAAWRNPSFLPLAAMVAIITLSQTAFLKYVGEKNLDSELAEMASIWQYDKWSLFDVHLSLSEPPQFKAAASDPQINQAFIYLIGCENLASLKKHWDEMKQGNVPDAAGFNASSPSAHDPYQAPPGKCAGLISQMACYDLKDGGHEKWLNRKFRNDYMWKQIAKLQQYAPNITKEKVLQTYVTTPADIQNKFANVVKGGYKQGAYHPLQMGYLRPNQYCSQYRTPIKNLYVGGSSVAPGGCVIWGPGYNCANAVAEDFNIKKWWSEPKIVTEAIKNNYVMKMM